jgi:anthranilate synthase component I
MNKKYIIRSETRELPADTLTPVGIYLRLRDVYPGALLLECTDFSSKTNAFSYVCIKPVLGIEVTENHIRKYFTNVNNEKLPLQNVTENVNAFINSLEVLKEAESSDRVHGLFGFTSFDSAFLFEKFDPVLEQKMSVNREIPFLKYDFFKIVLTFNHFNDTLIVTEYFNDDLPLGECDKVLNQYCQTATSPAILSALKGTRRVRLVMTYSGKWFLSR